MTFSFCIPCYDQDCHFLAGLLSELSKQTEAPDEILIFSSGLSDDNKLTLESEMVINETLVPILYENENERVPPGIARNFIADMCSTDVAMFFDVDDIPHPQRTEIIKSVFSKNSDIDALVHNYEIASADTKFVVDIDDIPDVSETTKHPSHTNLEVQPQHYPLVLGHPSVKLKVFDDVLYDSRMAGEDGAFLQNLIDNNYRVVALDLLLLAKR
jgi:glycosyltransferase involved in cell wall biosynthesis